MNVHFQCVIQVCRNNCPEPKCDGGAGDLAYAASTNNAAKLIEPRVPDGATAAPVGTAGTTAPIYTNVNRNGIAADPAADPTPAVPRQRLGSPRNLVDISDNSTRVRREAPVLHVYKRDAQEMTDVPTTRIIQVVAPGDVAFTLNPNQNETVVVQNLTDNDGNQICLSVPSFVGGLTMLLLVLIIACMVAVFLMLRVRQFDNKNSISNSMASLATKGYDHPEFVKVSQ